MTPRSVLRAALIGVASLALAAPTGNAHAAPADITVNVHATCNATPTAGVEVWAGAASGKFHNTWGYTDQAGVLTVTGLPANVSAPLGWTYNGHSDQMGMYDGTSQSFTVEVCEARIVFTAVGCNGQPEPGITLWAGVGKPTNGGQFDLGTTDDNGQLDVKQNGLVGLAVGYRTPDGGWVATIISIPATAHALTIHVCSQATPSDGTGKMPAAGSASGLVAAIAAGLVASGFAAMALARRRVTA